MLYCQTEEHCAARTEEEYTVKTALITGASSGIGREIARELSRRGWRLLLVARRRDRLEQLARQLPTPCRLYVCDLSQERSCRWLYERTREQNVTLLVNGAGFGLYGAFAQTDLDRELEMIDVNIRAVHILTKLFLRDFMRNNEGRILNIASSAGFLPGPLLATYYATKNYVVRLSEAIYEELRAAGSPVTISCLCPGPVETEFNQVAGAKSAARGVSCAQVARQAVAQTLEGRLLIFPGRMVRLGAAAARLVPEKQLLRLVRGFQEKKG
ncbi:MAG TPA: SDR family oxidoreductase [Candidatus Butyricicoccus stercorigallinarum]|nr:SDR family oxidoreductase [Candidatus Butyricicoccus stercorigallinarum]